MKGGCGLHRHAIVAAVSVIAFISACTAHEVLGHGGISMLVGGHINLLTSVYFRSTGGGILTDVAGPMMNLIVGALCWFFLRRGAALPILWQLFLVLAMAFNLFWGAGCFILSAVTNTGDLAFVLRQLQLEPVWVWRVVIGALGVFIYRWTMRLVASHLPAATPLFTAYLAAGIFSCIATLFFFGPVLPALREAALEGFGVGIGLLMLAYRRSEQKSDPPPSLITSGGTWFLVAALLVVIFIATLGHGFGDAASV